MARQYLSSERPVCGTKWSYVVTPCQEVQEINPVNPVLS